MWGPYIIRKNRGPSGVCGVRRRTPGVRRITGPDFKGYKEAPFARYVLCSSDCLGHPSTMVLEFRILIILLQGLNLALSATKEVTPSHEEMGNTFYIVNSLRSEMFRVCLSLTLNFEFIFWFKRFATFPNLFGSSTVFGFNGL